jgi:hypothetical protein
MSSYRRLNNIFSSKHPRNYNEARAFLQSGGTTPVTSISLTPQLLADLRLDGNELVYTPQELVVVQPGSVEQTLRALYDDVSKSSGVGHQLLYKIVRDTFLGITRDDVQAFLNKQWPYQLTRKWPERKVNKPIISREQNELWSLDLVFMLRYQDENWVPDNDQGRPMRYILVVLDNFTSYMFARPLEYKDSNEVREALEDVVTEAGATPRVLVSDLGTEFKGAVQQWVNQNNIRRSWTKSFTPLGRAER